MNTTPVINSTPRSPALAHNSIRKSMNTMNMTKTTLSLAAAFLAATSATEAAPINVDINAAAGVKPASNYTGANANGPIASDNTWNYFTTAGTAGSSITVGGLTFTLGSGWSAWGDAIPNNLQGDRIFTFSNATITISGLDTTKDYNLALITGVNANGEWASNYTIGATTLVASATTGAGTNANGPLTFTDGVTHALFSGLDGSSGSITVTTSYTGPAGGAAVLAGLQIAEAVVDVTPPNITTLAPADDATGMAVDINLSAIFDEIIQKGTGNIRLKKSADDSVVETFDVATSPRVTVSGTQLTIDPTSILTGLTGYYVEIDAGAIKDLADNSFAGISGSAAWNFTTIAVRQLTWDANGGGAGQTDGGGTWLDADQWWDGSANTTWSNYDSAAIGSGGSGGTITLGTVSANSVLFTNFTDTYTLSGGSLAVASGLTVNSDSGNVTISTPIGGAGGVAKSGTATLSLSGNNTYAGGTTIDAGMVVATHPQAAGTGTVTINGDGTLRYAGTSTAGLLGNTLLGGGTFELIGFADPYATVSGNLNAFSGTVRVDTTGGYARLATPSAGSALAKWVLRGDPAANQQGYYLFTGDFQSGTTYMIGELSSASDSGGGVLAGAYGASTTWQIGGLNTSSTFRGTIQNGFGGNGPVSVTKVGSGTLTLTGTHYYTGATTVSAGTLLVNSPGTLAAASAVTVNGGTLGGNGTINGSVTVAAGGSVAPGASAGTLSTGSFNVSAMANVGIGKLNFELDADTASSDQIAVTGTLTIGSGVLGLDDFAFTNLGGLVSGTYTLITTTAGISGTLDAGNLTGTILTGFTGTLQINGNNLELVVSSGTTITYDTWAAVYAPADLSNKAGDNDGDTLTNLQEFAFGTNPTVSTGEIVYSGGILTTPGAPRIVAESGSYSIVFGRRADYLAAGLTYTVQFSAGLDVWVDNNDGTNPPVQVATDGTINAMSVPFVDFISTPSGMQKPTFARVKVEMPSAEDSTLVPITTESAMRNEKGEPIYDCLEPHISKFGDTWYAYGFTIREQDVFAATCYSSRDLKTWTFRAKFPTQNYGMPLWNVLYNAKNNEYVGYGAQYGYQIHVYTSPSPIGPFTYKKPMSAVYGGPGDLLMYPDTDGKAYLIYNKYQGTIPQRFAYIYQLDEDYYDIVPSTLCNTNKVMEGFWMIKRNGTYFLLGSGLVSYDVDDNFYLTAPSPLGPWTDQGYIAPVGTKTFNSQTFQGLEVTGPKGTAYVFIGHRWKTQVDGLWANATSIWLPLKFTKDNLIEEMKWYENWTLDTEGATIAGAD